MHTEILDVMCIEHSRRINMSMVSNSITISAGIFETSNELDYNCVGNLHLYCTPYDYKLQWVDYLILLSVANMFYQI